MAKYIVAGKFYYEENIWYQSCLSSACTTLTTNFYVTTLAFSLRGDLEICFSMRGNFRAESRLAPSQWEMSLQSNAISHWLGANLESALDLKICELFSYICSLQTSTTHVWFIFISDFSMPINLMALCKTAVSPLLMCWRYYSLAWSHQIYFDYIVVYEWKSTLLEYVLCVAHDTCCVLTFHIG